MDILKRIDNLRKEKNWSIYKLAEEAGLTQSTLSNMFSRKTMPSISTLEQLCEAFGLTLSEFFQEENKKFSNEEMLLISNYRKLDEKDKKIINSTIDILRNKK